MGVDKAHTAHNKEKVLKNLEKLFGNVEASCRAAGVGRRTFYTWKAEDPEFREKVERLFYDGKMALVDLAESKLLSNINKGCTTSIIFTLKTIGRSRGYVEKRETQQLGADGKPIDPPQSIKVEFVSSKGE